MRETGRRLPIGLSDAEMSTIMAAAAPLGPDQRAAFVAEALEQLRTEPAIGVGVLFRIVCGLQRRYLDPPNMRRVGR